jgi:hypothetical protein
VLDETFDLAPGSALRAACFQTIRLLRGSGVVFEDHLDLLHGLFASDRLASVLVVRGEGGYLGLDALAARDALDLDPLRDLTAVRSCATRDARGEQDRGRQRALDDDHRRSLRRDAETRPDPGASPAHLASFAEVWERLLDGADELDVYIAKNADGTNVELAADLGIAEGTVRRRRLMLARRAQRLGVKEGPNGLTLAG